MKLNIPILLSNGSKDFGAVAQIDYLRIAVIARNKQNFTFKDYLGLEHNYFPLLENGQPNYEIFNWDRIVEY